MKINIKNHHKGALYILLALGLSRGLNIISLPFLSKQLSASDFADFSLFVTSVSLITAILLIGIDSSLIRVLSVHNEDSIDVPKKLFFLNGLIALTGLSISISILSFSGIDRFSLSKTMLFGSAVFLSVIFPLAQAYLRAIDSYKILFLSLFIGGIITPSVSVLMAYSGYGGESLVYGFVVGILISNIIAVRIKNYKIFRFSDVNNQTFINVIKIGLPATITAPLFWVMTSLDKWILNELSSKEALGVYAMAATLSAPYLMIASSLLTSFQPHALSLHGASNDNARDELKRDTRSLIYTLLLLWLVYIVLVAQFVINFMPQGYIHVIYIAPILSAAYLFNALFQLENIKFIFKKNTIKSIYAMVLSALVTTTLLFPLVFLFGNVGAGVSQLLGFATLYLTASKINKNQEEIL